MSKREDKKRTLDLYILEKIDKGSRHISREVSENYDVNQATVHAHINSLLNEGVIYRIGRGQYGITEKTNRFLLYRSKGELEEDTIVYEKYISDTISDLPDNVRRLWQYSASEMINNVIDHSGSETLEIIINKSYLKTRIVIDDRGVGIFNKIKNDFNLPSTKDALKELFKGKLTSDPQNHSGEGIFFSSKMVDSFAIFSESLCFSNDRYDSEEVIENNGLDKAGTTVMMELSNFSHKTTKEIFDQYADVDGGFSKTSIPLRNMFDDVPISRSQAKHVLNRLESFEHVDIDFADVEWAGQAFMHEMFSVYPKSHPNVTLHPINANEDIRRMLHHVGYKDAGTDSDI